MIRQLLIILALSSSWARAESSQNLPTDIRFLLSSALVTNDVEWLKKLLARSDAVALDWTEMPNDESLLRKAWRSAPVMRAAVLDWAVSKKLLATWLKPQKKHDDLLNLSAVAFDEPTFAKYIVPRATTLDPWALRAAYVSGVTLKSCGFLLAVSSMGNSANMISDAFRAEGLRALVESFSSLKCGQVALESLFAKNIAKLRAALQAPMTSAHWPIEYALENEDFRLVSYLLYGIKIGWTKQTLIFKDPREYAIRLRNVPMMAVTMKGFLTLKDVPAGSFAPSTGDSTCAALTRQPSAKALYWTSDSGITHLACGLPSLTNLYQFASHKAETSAETCANAGLKLKESPVQLRAGRFWCGI